MAHAAIAAEIHQALDAHGHFTAQVALDRESADFLAQLVHLRVGQVFDLRRVCNAGSVANLLRARAADTVDRSQRDGGVLMVGNVYPSDTGHKRRPFVTPKKRNR